jgi:hypothetical protein
MPFRLNVNQSTHFSYDYDPSNPQLGNRVMLSPNNCPRDTWSEDRFGNEYAIVSIVSDSTVRISSPFDAGISTLFFHTDWLIPAPLEVGGGTRVLFHDLETMSVLYRDRTNINQSMVNVVANQWRQPIAIEGGTFDMYFHVSQDGEYTPYSWHRDWMYITNNTPREPVLDTSSVPRSGDTIVITEGNRKGVKAFVRRVERTWGGVNTHVVYLDKASKTHYPLDCRVCKRHGIVFENQ